MKQRVLTVEKLTKYIKGILDNDPILRNVYVEGEVSNFKRHSSGHAYFSLKDNESRIQCVLFRNVTHQGEDMKDGDKVVLKGSVTLYEKTGQYQLYVHEWQKKGLGDLYVEYETLKRELESLGWFDPRQKKKIPFMPKRIGIVTSPTGAAIRDMVSVITRRYPHVELQIMPVSVQGERAAQEIARGIDQLNRMNEVEVILVGRGGGSIEELWAFNERMVAESIFRSTIPVISAVGHETDFTIADFVADLRAATPSAAGELAVPSMQEQKDRLLLLKRKLKGDMTGKIVASQERLVQIMNRYYFAHPEMYYAQKIQDVDLARTRLGEQMDRYLTQKISLLKERSIRLEGLDPLGILQRGYAAVQNEQGRFITDSDDLSLGERVTLIFSEGFARASIVEKGGKNVEKGVL